MKFSSAYIDIEMPLVKIPNEQLEGWFWSSKIIFLWKHNLGVTVEGVAETMEVAGKPRGRGCMWSFKREGKAGWTSKRRWDCSEIGGTPGGDVWEALE